jgi:hypothetical protein
MAEAAEADEVDVLEPAQLRRWGVAPGADGVRADDGNGCDQRGRDRQGDAQAGARRQ